MGTTVYMHLVNESQISKFYELHKTHWDSDPYILNGKNISEPGNSDKYALFAENITLPVPPETSIIMHTYNSTRANWVLGKWHMWYPEMDMSLEALVVTNPADIEWFLNDVYFLCKDLLDYKMCLWSEEEYAKLDLKDHIRYIEENRIPFTEVTTGIFQYLYPIAKQVYEKGTQALDGKVLIITWG